MEANFINPFAVQSPEDIDAADVVALFVEEFTEFPKIPKVGHTFLNGSRGSGKSMIFRYLEPDCQCIKLNKSFNDLPFLGIYVPIKNTDLKLTELARLENKHANLILNEHFMTAYIAVKVLSTLKKAPIVDDEGLYALAIGEFYRNDFLKLLERAGWQEALPEVLTTAGFNDYLHVMTDLIERVYYDVIVYLRKVAFADAPISYGGSLFGYLDFLTPMISGLKKLPFMPKAPIFLMIDDADNLNLAQTMILNSWVSYRTSAEISLKISTQMNYKTFRTFSDNRIDAPHDYSEVNFADIYTSQKNRYKERIESIIKKRLRIHHIDMAPEDFFPPDKEQESKIRQIADDLKNRWATEGRGYRPGDDALRYARPIYMTSLAGSSKSSSSYSYAGLEQLVHISSGVVRFFLEPASLMFGAQLSRNKGKPVTFISHSIQNEIICEQSEHFLISEFDKIIKDEISQGVELGTLKKLNNIIHALGGVFRHILLSDASERRVFSIAFSDGPDDDVKKVLDLGYRYGYFHKATIGNKEGTGRTLLYILSRRLAPFFKLDPTSFAGYKFVTNSVIRDAMANPKSFLGRIESRKVEEYLDDPQRELFGDV